MDGLLGKNGGLNEELDSARVGNGITSSWRGHCEWASIWVISPFG